MGRRWRPVQSSFFSTIKYRLRETQIPYNKIAEHLQDSEACLLSWWFMSCEPQKYVFLNQMVSPTAKGGGKAAWQQPVNTYQVSSRRRRHGTTHWTLWNHTRTELRQPHRTTCTKTSRTIGTHTGPTSEPLAALEPPEAPGTSREPAPETAPSFICAETPELALLSIYKIFHQQFPHDITLAFSSRALDVHSPPISPIWPRSSPWPAWTLALDVHHPPVWPRSSPQWPAGRSSTRRPRPRDSPSSDISGWLPGRLAPWSSRFASVFAADFAPQDIRISFNRWDQATYTSSTAQGGEESFKNRKPIGELGCCESGMAERIHWWTERCLRSPLFLSLFLPIYLSIYPSIYLSIHLSIIPSIHLSIYPSFHLSIIPSILSIYLSIHLFIYLSIYLSLKTVSLSVCLSVYLSV